MSTFFLKLPLDPVKMHEMNRLMMHSRKSSSIGKRRSGPLLPPYSILVEVGGMMSRDKEMLIYATDRMQKIKEVIDQLANTDITILSQGESGLGKEVISKLGKVFPNLMIFSVEKVLQPSISPLTYKKE